MSKTEREIELEKELQDQKNKTNPLPGILLAIGLLLSILATMMMG